LFLDVLHLPELNCDEFFIFDLPFVALLFFQREGVERGRLEGGRVDLLPDFGVVNSIWDI